jgi:hypothetical protein
VLLGQQLECWLLLLLLLLLLLWLLLQAQYRARCP